MTRTERRWLRSSVLFAILTATFSTIVLIMIAGAFAQTPFREGSLTAAANATSWSTVTAIFNATSLQQIFISALTVALAIIAILILTTFICGRCAGLGD